MIFDFQEQVYFSRKDAADWLEFMQVNSKDVLHQGRMGCFNFNSVTTVDELQSLMLAVKWPGNLSLRQRFHNTDKGTGPCDLCNLKWVGKWWNKKGELVWEDKWPGVGKWGRRDYSDG